VEATICDVGALSPFVELVQCFSGREPYRKAARTTVPTTTANVKGNGFADV